MSSTARASSLFHCDRRILTPEEWERIRLSLKLNAREIQITQYIFDDRKTECIAMELGISVHTINTYLQRLYLKLDVHSRTQLILRVLKDLLGARRAGAANSSDEQDLTANVGSIGDTSASGLLGD